MIALLLAGAWLGAGGGDRPRLLDDFERVGHWTAHPAEGVRMALASDRGRTGRALRLDFSFAAGAGYAIARRPLALTLPGNYAFSFWIRGVSAPNTLEFKLIDPSGENVWWYTERDRNFDGRWHQITVRKRQLGFAWGPRGGGELERAAALELVITAGQGGGSGRVWFDDLTLTPLPELGPSALVPGVTASSSAPGHPPALLLDGDSTTSWRSAAPRARLDLDFRRAREYGGITLFWETARPASAIAVLSSDDRSHWRELIRQGSAGTRDYLRIPDAESRYLRLDLSGSAAGIGLREVRLEPVEFASSRNAFFSTVARDARRGAYPRNFTGARANWTVVGVDRAAEEALLGEDGALESGSGGFSVEPFLQLGGQLLGWADVASTQTLEQSRLPLPSVEWHREEFSLRITAFAAGPPEASSAIVRYRIRSRSAASLRGTFYLALRPFQVNSPWQFLGTPGGAARIDSLRWDGRRAIVNGNRTVFPLVAPAGFGATAFRGGDVVALLLRGSPPAASYARDANGSASGVLAWPLSLGPGDSASIAIEIPLVPGRPPLLTRGGPGSVDSAWAAAVGAWEARVDRTTIQLPESGAHLSQSIASSLGYILINRDGPAIQPGSRAYERSWIRDGALTSAALLRFGHADAVREFVRWFARYLYPNGKVPCCVDRRGADPVSELDSNGEFIYLVAEYYRFTMDRALLEEQWPALVKAVGYLDSLRQTHRTAEYGSGARQVCFGLLPASISHEGYSAKPMHSYWDDFFALRGFKDAAALADGLGHHDQAARFAAIAAEFARELYRSIAAAMAQHRIEFIPGSAELGDFDATSTTIALAPGGELERLPRPALERTFERYWEVVAARHQAGASWEAYTPYELRTVGALLRLGWRERSLQLLEWFLAEQTPTGWNQWPEVVWRDPHAPKFIGDLPHTWVASDFLRSAADLFAYERESDSSLVLGAGIAERWLDQSGLAVHRLGTWWGSLSYSARRAGDTVLVAIAAGMRPPPGGIFVPAPGDRPARRALVDGLPAELVAGAVRLRSLPARIAFER